MHRALERFARALATRTAPLAVAAALSGTAAAQSFNPGEVYVQALNYGGSGCPQGTVAHNLSPDAKALSFLFDSFAVDTPSNGGRRTKKSCAINLQLHVPAGWTYTLFSVDYRGYAEMDKRSEARLRSWYAMQGQEIRISNNTMRGPMAQNYLQRAWVPLDALPYLTCSTLPSVVTINTELTVDGPSAMLTVDSVDGEIRQDYGIAWKPCSTSSTWESRCEAVLETQWGTNIQVFNAVGLGKSYLDARNAATKDVQTQCDKVRSGMRPLVKAATRCIINASQCVATPR
jgi:hypothetical protein